MSSAATLRAAGHVIDEAMPLADAAAQSDLIYLSQPISGILETIDEIDSFVRPGTLITDAGSTKSEIIARAGKSIHRARFIGGHPMAGKQSRGVAEAEARLFEGRPYVLTSRDAELERWIERMGARVVIMNPEEHDRLVALTSHLPQLMSTALAAAIGGEPGASAVAGPAAVDMTRLALSPYEIWRDIFATNSAAIDNALGTFIRKLEELRAHLKGRAREPEIEQEFAQASEAARALREGK